MEPYLCIVVIRACGWNPLLVQHHAQASADPWISVDGAVWEDFFLQKASMVWLLDEAYDIRHRAYMMREKEMLEPLKICYHGVSGATMPYDPRYTPHIQQAGLLPWIQLVSRSTPSLNAPLVSSLVDRWRPETHSFHLRTREMTVTLQDVSLFTGILIDGSPLCMSTNSDGWREQMTTLIGTDPTKAKADVEEGQEKKKKERKVAGAPFTWIQANFTHCPEDAIDDVIQTHARVYMWYVISRTLFPDATGKNAPWMWLKALTVFDSKWRWSSATLGLLVPTVGGCVLQDH